MEEEVQASLMHHQRCGEGECFTNKASQARSVRIVPAFHVSRFTCFPADSRMLLFWDHGLIRSPEIGEAVTCMVGKWNGLPQTATGGLAAISNGIRDHLTALAAQSDPDPSLVRLVRGHWTRAHPIPGSSNLDWWHQVPSRSRSTGQAQPLFFDPCDDRVA